MNTRLRNHIVVAAVLLAGIGAYFGYRTIQNGNGSAQAVPALPQPTAVRVVRPERRDLKTGVSYMGTVSARKEVKVIARIPGTVIALPFREGETAKEGEAIALLDAPEIRAQVARLTAERDYWAKRHEADLRLVGKNALAPDQADAGERSLKTTEAALLEATSQLRKAQESAPFDGTVLSWFAEPGQGVLPGQPILSFGSVEAELRVEVAEEDLGRGIRVGTAVDIEAEDGRTVRAAVQEVAPAANAPSRTFTAKIALPAGAEKAARVGSSIRVNFILDSLEDALTLPVSAIVSGSPTPHIFIVRDGHAVKVPVETGLENRGRVAVRFPWNGSDQVAISNLGGLEDGTPVFTVDAEEAVE